MKKAVLIYSGGLDSTVLLYHLLHEKRQVTCINFFYGAKHNDRERRAAKLFCTALKVPLVECELGFMKAFNSALTRPDMEIPEGHFEAAKMKSTVVPFRNGIMCSIAAGLADSIKCEDVYIAVHGGDHHIYPDCRNVFITSMCGATRNGTYSKVEVWAPFLFARKSAVVQYGSQLEVPFNKTYTCYNGRKKQCGRCGACVERKEAFKIAGVQDPTIYEEAL